MPKRLAITISGAVSLGSYEAGVLYEIIHAIGQHNTDPATPPANQIKIDVLTGASAGGMTATIAAQKLAYEADALDDPYNNAFYLPWVVDVGIDGLLAMQGKDDPGRSILSSEYVVDISRRYLTGRYTSHATPPPKKHAAAADEIGLGLAMSNLNGVDYSRALLLTGNFTYTRHQDELATIIHTAHPADDSLGFWDPLRNAAVACGAFPFAFKVVDVVRHGVEFDGATPPVAPLQPFAYTDGGVFQNEPLGLAKNLVDEADEHLGVEDRFYLFVAPGSRSSTSNAEFSAAKARYVPTAMQLVSAIFSQARFQDWIKAERMNDQVVLFNAQALALQRMFLQGSAAVQLQQAEHFQAAANDLLSALFPDQPVTQPPHEKLEVARERLKRQFKQEYEELSSAAGDAWIDTILALEKSAALGTRDEMTIFGITAEDRELASYELSAFAGFFDRRFRDHDYDVGRRKAQEFLAKPGTLGPIRFAPEPIRAIDASLDGLSFENMDHKLRERVRDALRKQSHAILKASGLGPALLREAVDFVVVRNVLNAVLKL
jgi:predicted acylesterase/phospholipase RssA